jgi:hypothetical protein
MVGGFSHLDGYVGKMRASDMNMPEADLGSR